jgi:DNA-binding CsgD family transcriptional regulator
MDDLTATQLRQALRAAQELAELRDLAEFPARVAQILRELIPCEHAGYNAIDVPSGRATVVADPSDSVFDGGPEVLAAFGDQNPMIVRAAGGATEVMQLSDHISRRDFHRTDLYDHVYRRSGLEYQLGAQLPAPRRSLGRPTELVGLSLARTRGDFGEGDRALLAALQPLLAATLARLHELALLRATGGDDGGQEQAVVLLVDDSGTLAWASPAAADRIALAAGEPLPATLGGWLERERDHPGAGGPGVRLNGRVIRLRLVRDAYPGLDAVHLTPAAAAPDRGALRGLGLTPRQADVLALLLEGKTSRAIAGRLYLSTRTVEKHIDGIYSRLGVSNRSQAILATMARLAA